MLHKIKLDVLTAKPGELELVSLVVWVLAVVVEASPSLQMATLAGDATRLADIMTQIAVAGIKPLVTVMLTQPHVSHRGSTRALCVLATLWRQAGEHCCGVVCICKQFE
ncbi:hypothetical protein E2C01_102787 [Portunus trituberculatus]|uniref:Uncharacterized protein n=1 Tax=Portunus trituberculatus TaxID=210409 RepID=A0A5B7KNL4_PORTR|nr:hypothetical protein [Portunus trituberculatus]